MVRVRSLALVIAALVVLQACASPGSQRAAATLPAIDRVHVIGASVSGGFIDGPLFGADRAGDSVALGKLLSAWADGEVRVTSHPAMQMWSLFQDPLRIGELEIELARRRQPDLVVAIDFLFWFAYGHVQGDEAAARGQLLERGLDLLARLGAVQIVIGDLPDMRGAAVRMLNPRQIPSPEQLVALNARIAQYAAAHDNVRLVPLADLVRELKTEGVALPLASGAHRTGPGALLQADRLHATRLGMAVLLHRLQGPLGQLFAPGHALRERCLSFEQCVEAARAGFELDELLERSDT